MFILLVNTSRRVFFLLPAYSASEKLNWLIAQVPLRQSTRSGMIGGLVQTFLSFASNGDGFIFRDATLSDDVLERNLTLDEFPSPAALWSRYCARKSWARDIRRITEPD